MAALFSEQHGVNIERVVLLSERLGLERVLGQAVDLVKYILSAGG